MKKILTILAFAAALLTSCSKFHVENTATVNLAGNWMCSIYASDGTNWVPVEEAEFLTYNTADNVPTEMWIDDGKGFWDTACKIDANNSGYSFGKSGKEYLDYYNDVAQLIWGGKVTVDGAKAPGTKSVVDKIEFYMAFSDDDYDGDDTTHDAALDPYCCAYYVVGYRRTGFPEDDDTFVDDWTLPAIVEVPTVSEKLPTP